MGVTAFHRRRHHSHSRLIPAISAVSGALLLLFAVFSFLAPSPTDHEHLRQHLVLNNGVVNAGVSAFRVPTSGGRLDRDIWKSKRAKFYYGCSNASKTFVEAQSITVPKRYLLIVTSGGLNQQRTGLFDPNLLYPTLEQITDAVVAARILNATLVVPKLDQKSFWKDASNFSEIFDVEWFISHLAKDVKIIKELPRRGGKIWTPYTMRVPRKCSAKCYQSRVLPNLLKKHSLWVDMVRTGSMGRVVFELAFYMKFHITGFADILLLPASVQMHKAFCLGARSLLIPAVQLTKFDYRLSNKLDKDLQKLRCRVNYHALKFTDPIIEMGERLVHRMRMRSKHYVALHLRFEPDMLAFSGCYYGGGDKERIELGAIRKRWKTLHGSNPDRGRRQGKCPLTPEEVGLMLRALGYGKDVHIYVASGEVYRGEETLAPLKVLFPNFYSKDTLASKEELEPFAAFSSRMAALDFLVCDESDVFVTNNNGNMAKILAGRRRYNGHKPTIRPNAKKLYRLFLNRVNMTWEAFASGVRTYQRGFMGEPMELRPGRGAFHENPATCVCEDIEAKEKMELGPRKLGKDAESATRKDVSEVVDDQNDNDDEPEWSDPDDYDDQNAPLGKGLFNGTGSDDDTFLSEEPELEDMLSD
ncbi:hypothetical protein RHSIM_Rhsim07G0254800 [Rhododendron simsii]|uniref:O-fucosyltransferase family protein n=1 Tax=Rhododendron simsii TaxID=118357 RepID=A0A834GPX7_RHOSS|nr:hypothetical protein RHSIM_Rhsim07G0254800 [Rhododendron simsii]